MRSRRFERIYVDSQEIQARLTLVRMLSDVGIFGLRDDNLEEDFVLGLVNPSLKDLGIDSLSEMELCIALENRFDVSISPTSLSRFSSLDELVRYVARKMQI